MYIYIYIYIYKVLKLNYQSVIVCILNWGVSREKPKLSGHSSRQGGVAAGLLPARIPIVQ